MCHLPAWMCLLTWTPCTLGWDGVEPLSHGPDHAISSPLPTPGKFRGSSPGLVFPATRPTQEPPRVTSSSRGNLRRFQDPHVRSWGGDVGGRWRRN